MGRSLVIVESPAKAKTINKYLGKDFIVKSSYGHVRDLPTGSDEEDPADRLAKAREAQAKAKAAGKKIVKATPAEKAAKWRIPVAPRTTAASTVMWRGRASVQGTQGVGNAPPVGAEYRGAHLGCVAGSDQLVVG